MNPEDMFVERTVWNWREPGQVGTPAKPREAIIRSALIKSLLILALAVVIYVEFKKPVPGIMLGAAAIVMFAVAVVSVKAYILIEKVAMRFGEKVGLAMTWLLLTPFYYLFFSLARLGMALQGKDPLCRAWGTGQKSYWLDLTAVKKPKDYTRQF